MYARKQNRSAYIRIPRTSALTSTPSLSETSARHELGQLMEHTVCSRYTHLTTTKLLGPAHSSAPPTLSKSELHGGALGCWFMRNRHVRASRYLGDEAQPFSEAADLGTPFHTTTGFAAPELTHIHTHQLPTHTLRVLYTATAAPSSVPGAVALFGQISTNARTTGHTQEDPGLSAAMSRSADPRRAQSERLAGFTQRRRTCARRSARRGTDLSPACRHRSRRAPLLLSS